MTRGRNAVWRLTWDGDDSDDDGDMNRFDAIRIRSKLTTGSSMPVVAETVGGTFVVKLLGAAQGALPLVAEIIVAVIAERIGLPVPERALVTLDASTPTDDKNDELADLLGRSHGENLGFRWLDGAVDLEARDADTIPDDFALRTLWLDALVMNVDRSTRNTNILVWRRQPWLIDHGAALPFQHAWSAVTEQSPHQAFDFGGHLFGDRVQRLPAVAADLERVTGRADLQAAADAVPEWLLEAAPFGHDPARVRAAYAAFLWKRLRWLATEMSR
jgi:hypothetical protein